MMYESVNLLEENRETKNIAQLNAERAVSAFRKKKIKKIFFEDFHKKC